MRNAVSVTCQSPDGDTWITSHFSADLHNRISVTRATPVVEVMKMWLLLSIPFGMSGCVFITLMVFDLLDPDRKADVEREVLLEAVSSPQRDAGVEDAIPQTPSSAMTEPASVLLEPVAVDAQV
jgi:hypothetical protein